MYSLRRFLAIKSRNFQYLNYSDKSCFNNRNVENINIPVPWGQISGILWGPDNIQPVLALHGWQDNANTWKPLVDHLPPNIPILAVDFAGHGMSTWHPPGMTYSQFHNILLIKRIKIYFGWKKISLMGHSMGAISSFLYGSLFPHEIQCAVLLDNLYPDLTSSESYISNLSTNIDNFLLADDRNLQGNEPPVYNYETLIEKMYTGYDKSIKKENCNVLLERGVESSKHDAEKYYFKRDSRLKYLSFLRPDLELVKLMASRIQFPLLHVMFENSFECRNNYDEILNLLKKCNEDFIFHSIPGTHHEHINNPMLISTYVTKFLQKYNMPIY